jgi:hypothetical protein
MKPLLAHTGFSVDNLERGIWQQLDAMLVKDDLLPESIRSQEPYAMTSFFQLALSPSIVRNSVKIAIVVGLLLNIINQGGSIWARADISWPHIFLNFLVPYCVATISAVKNNRTDNNEKNKKEENRYE